MNDKKFELLTQDKKIFIQVLTAIFNLEGQSSQKDIKFIQELKVLLAVPDFDASNYTDRAEERIVQEISKIQSKELIDFIFTIAEDIESKKSDAKKFKKSIENILNKIPLKKRQKISTKYFSFNNEEIEIKSKNTEIKNRKIKTGLISKIAYIFKLILVTTIV